MTSIPKCDLGVSHQARKAATIKRAWSHQEVTPSITGWSLTRNGTVSFAPTMLGTPGNFIQSTFCNQPGRAGWWGWLRGTGQEGVCSPGGFRQQRCSVHFCFPNSQSSSHSFMLSGSSGRQQQGALSLHRLISSTMTLPCTCPSKVSFPGRVNFTQISQLRHSCLSPGRGGNVRAGQLFSTKRSSVELITCCLFPCFVIRKHPEGAATPEVVLEDVEKPLFPCNLNLPQQPSLFLPLTCRS